MPVVPYTRPGEMAILSEVEETLSAVFLEALCCMLKSRVSSSRPDEPGMFGLKKLGFSVDTPGFRKPPREVLDLSPVPPTVRTHSGSENPVRNRD